ncbi:hypothetical protein [Rhizobium sp. CSW-27]|uniref:hypothetical protein n=1 Tax=Rhizobium sp. CSW-27 TaxID=2839985 RepID=UPI001C0182DF|nr:hypothetical protein [Rhizobium sp. CSW-27]MBT9370760.1 hypothetical protein [Rhizobium sp. CSW-27]
MTKHRGFPGGMPGTGVQFTIRRANPKGVTPIKALPRKARPGSKEHRIDAAFLHALWHHFGAEPFERGNLDAARLNLLFGREVVPVEKDFDPMSYEALLRIDERVARQNFPESFDDVFEV